MIRPSRIIVLLWRGMASISLVFMLFSCPNKYEIESYGHPALSLYDGGTYRLKSIYGIQVDDSLYFIPPDFITDLASIPKPLRFVFSPKDSAVIAPSVLHDYFYSGEINVTRKFADDVFYNHLVYEGFPRYKAWLFWVSVRLFGIWSFKECEWLL